MMERGPWRKMRVAERRGWRDADGSVLLPPLHPLAALSRFQPPPASTPVSHPPRSGSRSQGWKSPAILLIVGGPRFSLCFSLFPPSPLLLRSALRSPYLQPSSSWRTGSSRSRLFIHSRFSENNIQFCDSLDRYLELSMKARTNVFLESNTSSAATVASL